MNVERVLLEEFDQVTINIGYQGEKNHTKVIISCPVMFRDYPDAVASMVVKPPQGDLYPVSLTRDGNDLTWDVSEADVAITGTSDLQLTFTDGSGDTAEIIKTVYGSCSSKASLMANGEAPDPVQSWLDEAGAALATFETEIGDIRKITTATDADEGKALSPKTVVSGKVTEWEYVDLADPEDIKEAVDEWLDDHPEATTTVQDGAITEAKLNDSLKADLAWQDDLDDVKNAFTQITGFVGTTDVGDHVEEVEKLSFANSSVTIQTVSVKTFTDNKVTVSGTAASQVLRTLQDDISLTAGKYRFSIDSPILSTGYQIQLFNITSNTVVYSFTSTSSNKATYFTIDSTASCRIRVLLPTSAISDTQKVSLVNLKTVDSTLSFATKELISEVDDFANRIKQKCKLIENAGNIIPVNETAITFSNAKIKNDNTILFSKEAKRITATADGGWVKFSFGGTSYDFDTVTVVFYLPYESYSSTSPTSVELRIYANGTGQTPIVSTSNCCWGWNYLKIPKSKTGLSANTKINAVVIVLKETSGTTESEFGEIIVDSIILDMKMKPTFILDLDQIWEKSIDNGAYAYCRTNNVPYTVHTWQYANLNSAKVTEMKTAMLNGCEFSYYGGYTNESAMDQASSYSGAIAECELMENDIVPFTHKRFLTYGCGAHRMNQYLRESLEANGVKAIRGRWIQSPVGYFSDLSTWLPYSIEISYGNSTLQEIKDHIDEAVANGSCVVAFTHGVCNDDESTLGVSSSAIRLTTFKDMIDYLVNLRNHGQIQICTMEQFVNQCIG